MERGRRTIVKGIQLNGNNELIYNFACSINRDDRGSSDAGTQGKVARRSPANHPVRVICCDMTVEVAAR